MENYDERKEAITKFMVDAFKEMEIEDTGDNRLIFLLGLQEAWDEDPEVSLAKTFWKVTLDGMIFAAKIRQSFNI